MSKQPGIQSALNDFRKMQTDIKNLNNKTPRIVGHEAVAFIQSNFEKEAYKGDKWPARSPATNAAYDKRYGIKGSVINSGNKLLRQTGNLYDAIRSKVKKLSVFVGFDTNKVPYGQIHNEGGEIATRGGKSGGTTYFSNKRDQPKNTVHTMPKRQFMPKPTDPEEPIIMQRVLKKLKFELDRIIRNFKK